jgi:hypothetical protein
MPPIVSCGVLSSQGRPVQGVLPRPACPTAAHSVLTTVSTTAARGSSRITVLAFCRWKDLINRNLATGLPVHHLVVIREALRSSRFPPRAASCARGTGVHRRRANPRHPGATEQSHAADGRRPEVKGDPPAHRKPSMTPPIDRWAQAVAALALGLLGVSSLPRGRWFSSRCSPCTLGTRREIATNRKDHSWVSTSAAGAPASSKNLVGLGPSER